MSIFEKILAANLVGLDLGTEVIKFVQLRSSPKGYRLVKSGIFGMPPEAMGEDVEPELKEALLVETIKKIFKENKINSRNVVTGVSGDAVIVRHVKLPAMSEEELRGVIQYEAEQYIPNIEQFSLDFKIIGEATEDNQKKIEVVLVGVKHELLEKHLKLLDDAGLRSVIIDVDCLALSNAYEVNYAEEAGEGVVLLHVGSKLSTVSIMDGLTLRNTRDIFIGGKNFTRDIQREFNLSYAQAEELKKLQASIIVESDDISLLRMPNKEDRSIQIFEAINPTLNKLITEIRRFFDYYETLSKKRNLHKVILSGGTAMIKNMDKYLEEKLGIPVETNNPFKNIEVAEHETGALSGSAILYPVAVGLAARRI